MSLNKELSFKILIIFFNLVYHKSDNIYLSAKSILFIVLFIQAITVHKLYMTIDKLPLPVNIFVSFDTNTFFGCSCWLRKYI